MTLRHSLVISPLLKPKEYIITFVNPPICIILQVSHTLTFIATLYYTLIRCIEDLALVGAVRPLGSVRGHLYTFTSQFLQEVRPYILLLLGLLYLLFSLLFSSYHRPFHR